MWGQVFHTGDRKESLSRAGVRPHARVELGVRGGSDEQNEKGRRDDSYERAGLKLVHVHSHTISRRSYGVI